MTSGKQPWLSNPSQEFWFILAPAVLPVLAVFLFQDYFLSHSVSLGWWVVLVMCIDVSHVYSTLFRLYWDRETFHQYNKVLIMIPVVALVAGFALHYWSAGLFWRLLAYVAVYHFVRQQYGFMRLYARQESPGKTIKFIDTISIYNATLYPLVYWHLNATDAIAWFVKGDFISLSLDIDHRILLLVYLLILAVYVVKETIVSLRQGFINLPKNLLVVGTYASWYVGIVAFQADLIFTLLNVVAHGIPYMALVWIHGTKKGKRNFSFNARGLGIFIGLLLIVAYIEEYLWDGMIWRDHPEIFPFFAELPLQHPVLASIAVAVLVLPQVTHYVLDGFIWRFSKDRQSRVE